MRYLLDTHILVWAASERRKLSVTATAILTNLENVLSFSVASLWELAIKHSLGRSDFHVEPSLLRRGLLDNGYAELPIQGQHALTAGALPPIHKDPFDRILLAQALVEGMTLVTVDARLTRYPAPVQLV